MGKEQRILGIGNGSFSAADPEQCSRNPGVLEGLNSLERSAISAERKGNRRFQENGAWRSHDRCSRCGADAADDGFPSPQGEAGFLTPGERQSQKKNTGIPENGSPCVMEKTYGDSIHMAGLTSTNIRFAVPLKNAPVRYTYSAQLG